MTPITGKILENKYEILNEIKKGGFGIVYYGLDRNLNKSVAIKEIAPNLLDDPKYLDMFQEEALNIAKLSHNNIVHIYELTKTSNGHLFIIMEYIDGVDMEKVIRKVRKEGHSLPAHLTIYIVAQVCMALDYAHQRRDAFTNKPLNLVHQDISPSNIMLSRNGDVKLIDFGIASVRRHHKSKKDTKLRGKIPYMAPEQLLMGNHPDHRSDLFSLGLVLYEALTGERLFSSQDEIIAAGKNSKLLKKTIKAKKLPSSITKILMTALEVDLEKRYQSANHMYIDLLQYLISANETGEMMDELGEFIDTHFAFKTPGTKTFDTTGLPSESSPQITSPSSPYSTPPMDLTVSAWKNDDLNINESESLFSDGLLLDQSSDGFQPTYTSELEGENENLKTVIDVLRIEERSSKKRLWQFGVGLLLAILLFAIGDTIKGWTPVGVGIYDKLFPPEIEIVTIPPDARIDLDGKAIEGRTPLSINEITPGVHKLELALDGYKPIVKSVFVPRDGDIRIQGEAAKSEQKASYLFKFTTDIEINSNPPGALVYINGTRFNQTTPCILSWEVGNPLKLELEKPGFDKLSGFSLDTINGFDDVEDRRFWQTEIIEDPFKKYAVSATFRKEVLVETVPAGVQIFDTAGDALLGTTSSTARILLTPGRHELEFRKANFLSGNRLVEIDEEFDSKIRIVLSRVVRFTSFDELDGPGQSDLEAELTSLTTGRNEFLRSSKKTPVELTLPAYTYTAVFEKPGYDRKEVNVSPGDRLIRAALVPAKTHLKIIVLDALSNLPIPDARIYYNLFNSSQTEDLFFATTDSDGTADAMVPEGSYLFRVEKNRYRGLERSIILKSGDTSSFELKIFPSN